MVQHTILKLNLVFAAVITEVKVGQSMCVRRFLSVNVHDRISQRYPAVEELHHHYILR